MGVKKVAIKLNDKTIMVRVWVPEKVIGIFYENKGGMRG